MMSPMPERIQRKRTKGFRLPPNTVCVTRPHEWSNPYKIGSPDVPDAETAVRLYRENFNRGTWSKQLAHEALDGYEYLACWCKIGNPCHVDVLIDVLYET